MKQHALPAAIAAIVAAGTAGGIEASKTTPTPVIHSISVSKHAWPDMSDAEKASLTSGLSWLKGGKVIVLCDGADCRDLQTDIDDAMEDAGVDSTRDRPVVPLGYGIAVVGGPGDGERAARLAQAIKASTGGRLEPKAQENELAKDMLVVAIGKRPRR